MSQPVQARVTAKQARLFADGREIPLMKLRMVPRQDRLDVTSFDSPWLQFIDGYRGTAVIPVDPAAEPPQWFPDVGKAAWLWMASIGLLRILFNSLSVDVENGLSKLGWPQPEQMFPDFDITFKRIERCSLDLVSAGVPLIVPDHLHHQIPQIVRWEEGGPLFAYHDWCLDRGWSEQAAHLARQDPRTADEKYVSRR